MERWLLIRIGLLGGLCFVAALVYTSGIYVGSGPSEQYLTVRFLDVGQGDAIHITTPDGIEVLIDGGPSATMLRPLAQGRSFFDSYIDVLVATHPDTDHVGGLVDVLGRYQVGMIVETVVEHDAPAAVAFAAAAGAENAERIVAQAGQVLQLGASTTLRVLSPTGDTSKWESNTASIVLQLAHGDVEFMLTGDAPIGIEEYLVAIYGDTLESEVLKLGHHGSRTSTSEGFLAAVAPEVAVVSAELDSRYGHPHKEVVERVTAAGVPLLSTATVGTITFQTNGSDIWQVE